MKIFCLGFHKTGTLSLAKALRILGYKARHGFKPQSDLIEKALHDGLPPLEYVEDGSLEKGVGPHDAYLDLYALRWFYPKLDQAYPGSKFILTTRCTEEWLASVHRQIKKRPNSPFFHYWYYQTDRQRCLDKEFWEGQIREYFGGHPTDFLEINLIQNSGSFNWKILCKFLGKSIPDKPFPHANKSPEATWKK